MLFCLLNVTENISNVITKFKKKFTESNSRYWKIKIGIADNRLFSKGFVAMETEK